MYYVGAGGGRVSCGLLDPVLAVATCGRITRRQKEEEKNKEKKKEHKPEGDPRPGTEGEILRKASPTVLSRVRESARERRQRSGAALTL